MKNCSSPGSQSNPQSQPNILFKQVNVLSNCTAEQNNGKVKRRQFRKLTRKFHFIESPTIIRTKQKGDWSPKP